MAYNRVGLTQYFTHRSVDQLLMQPRSWYEEQGIEVHLGDPVEEIDTLHKRVFSRESGWTSYDICVLATGSSAALPPNVSLGPGIFVYRTLQDLEAIIAWASRENVQHAGVVGGGLLGLEAAKAAKDLGLNVTVYERANRLMARQLDDDAAKMLQREIEKLDIETCVGDCPGMFQMDDDQEEQALKAVVMAESKEVRPTEMLIYAIGIRPRDQLAHDGLLRASRGGFQVNEQLETTADNVYAIGECASFNDMIYGLVAPGYE